MLSKQTRFDIMERKVFYYEEMKHNIFREEKYMSLLDLFDDEKRELKKG